jgi:hypothetical protein
MSRDREQWWRDIEDCGQRVAVTGAVIVLVACVCIGLKIAPNLEARNSPPLSCQLLGGSWSLWSGWRCG